MNISRTAIKAFSRTFSKDESGATAIEYGLFAALVGAVIVTSVASLGTNTNAGFTKLNDAMTTETDTSGTDG